MTTSNDDLATRVLTKLKEFLQNHWQEKVYLHTDKPYYAAGDTLWMKAYLVDAVFHEADSLSGILYVNLSDEGGNIIDRRTLRVSDGYSNAEFALPDSLPQGNYQLTAFTNWMRNTSDEFFFRKNFPVFRYEKNRPMANSSPEVADLQLFPESGNLVNGLRSRVGFKAVTVAGKGVEVKGYVEEVGGQKIVDFQTEHLGMGSFTFTPKAGKRYVAKVKSSYKELSVPLPMAQDEGVVMLVGNLMDENIKFTISHNLKPERVATEPFLLVGHLRGRQIFSGEIPKNAFSQFYLSRAKFPEEGVIQFTLFDKNLNPVCERIIFNDLKQRLNMNISTNKAVFLPRENVEMMLSVTDQQGKPVQGNFSMAVTSADQVPTEKLYADHLVSNLLVSSELRGSIEQPAYYFDDTQEPAKQHLDLLMLTQGWRRFLWKEILQDNHPQAAFAYEKGLVLNGRLMMPPRKKPEPTPITLLVISQGNPLLVNGVAGIDGEFSIPNLDFWGMATVSLKGLGLKVKDRDASIILRNISAPMVGTQAVPLSAVSIAKDDIANYLTKMEVRQRVTAALKAKTLDETGTPTKTEKPKFDNRRSTYGTPDFTYKVTEGISDGINDFYQLISGRLPGVNVTGTRILIRGISSFNASTDPLFLIDGVTADASAVASIPIKQIEAIDVLKGPSTSTFGSRGATGVINVLTKRLNNTNPTDDAANGRVKGYSLVKEFYAPRYEAPKRLNAIPDYRSTIYWNPMIQTDVNGKAKVTFWNSDENNTTFRIAIEGATPKGQLGVGTKTYSVK